VKGILDNTTLPAISTILRQMAEVRPFENMGALIEEYYFQNMIPDGSSGGGNPFFQPSTPA
jgi:hypothetical protein